MIRIYVMRVPQRLMRRPGGSLCPCAMAIAACACLALAVHGCGIIVSSDCALRANCHEEGGGPSDVTTPDDIDNRADTPPEGAEVGPERDARSEPNGMEEDALA